MPFDMAGEFLKVAERLRQQVSAAEHPCLAEPIAAVTTRRFGYAAAFEGDLYMILGVVGTLRPIAFGAAVAAEGRTPRR